MYLVLITDESNKVFGPFFDESDAKEFGRMLLTVSEDINFFNLAKIYYREERNNANT